MIGTIFFNVAWQPVDVRKVCKMVMNLNLSQIPPIKGILKTFAYLIMKKILKKNAKLKSHSI